MAPPPSSLTAGYRGVPESLELFRRAEELIPGGTQLISRRPSQFAYGISPIYAARAKGSRLIDVDGNEYIDWGSGITAVILGYADEVVDEAVREQIGGGLNYPINHPLEIELAELLVETIPCAEMVRYAKCGGEACAIAVRIARGTTGRDKILFSGYHGWHDWYLAANLAEQSTLNQHLFPGIEPTGVPRALEGTSFPFPYGDLNALAELLDRHSGEVAAVILEPLRTAMPPAGYLEGVVQLAHDHGAVAIFDEVSTGFRFSPGGVQPVVGVTPDMAVFAKSISNGYPMGAVVGRREVMEPAARMFISSTYWSDPIGLRAAVTTLKELKRRNVTEQLTATGSTLKQRLNLVAEETGAAIRCTGLDVSPKLEFDIPADVDLREVTTLYIQEMARRGCHGYAGFYTNAAQTEADIDQTVDAAGETFEIIRQGLETGRIGDLLDCEVRRDSFRRLVS